MADTLAQLTSRAEAAEKAVDGLARYSLNLRALNVVFILSRIFPNILMDGRGYLRICICICHDRGLIQAEYVLF